MWTVVFIAPNRDEAERIRSILTREGILVKLKNTGTQQSVEVLVPESEADEALEILSTV